MIQEMPTPYHILAKYYDEFQNQQDHDSLIRDLRLLIQKHILTANKSQVIKLGDLGCGTGVFSLAFASEGFEVTALDLSEAMLSIVEVKKAKLEPDVKSNLSIQHADIRDYQFAEKQDVLLALTDTLNHLDSQQLSEFFSVTKHNLCSGGLLIFDLLKLDFFRKERGNQTFFVELSDDSLEATINFNSPDFEEEPGLAMVWENSWLDDEQIAISDLTFFEKDQSSNFYKRYTEQIVEYYHHLAFVESLAQEDFELMENIDFPERQLFVLKKK